LDFTIHSAPSLEMRGGLRMPKAEILSLRQFSPIELPEELPQWSLIAGGIAAVVMNCRRELSESVNRIAGVSSESPRK
jgi:hypothetical protein